MEAQKQFLALAEKSSGKNLATILAQVLQSPDLFVFGEFLELDSVKKLAEAEDLKPHYDLLELFAYGTFDDYVAKKDTLPAIAPSQEKKLKQLTIVTLAAQATNLPYSVLTEHLGVSDVRELEDLIISCIYAGILAGKIDQANSAFVVQSFMGRDVQKADIPKMAAFITQWRQQADAMLARLSEQQDAIVAQVAQRRENDAALQKRVKDAKETMKLVLASGGGADDQTTSMHDMYSNFVRPARPGGRSREPLGGGGGRRRKARG